MPPSTIGRYEIRRELGRGMMGIVYEARDPDLGRTLGYWLLAGQQPFGGAGVPRIITRVLREDPDPPSQVVRTLPPDVDYLIARALAKDPEDRYPNGKAMAEDVEDILAGRMPRHRAGAEHPGCSRNLAILPAGGRALGPGRRGTQSRRASSPRGRTGNDGAVDRRAGPSRYRLRALAEVGYAPDLGGRWPGRRRGPR